MSKVRRLVIAASFGLALLPVVRHTMDSVSVYACGGPFDVNSTRTSIGPGGNPAGTVYGSLNYCAKTYAQGSVYNSYTDASMQTCDYTNTGSGCSSFTYEAFPGGHILSPGNVYSPGSSFADGTINWYDGTGYNSTPSY